MVPEIQKLNEAASALGNAWTRAELKLGIAISKVTLICGTEAWRKLKTAQCYHRRKGTKSVRSTGWDRTVTSCLLGMMWLLKT